MKHFLLSVALLFSLTCIKAQTVTQAWAVLPAHPYDIKTDASGNVYTVYYNNSNIISKVTPDGTLTATWATLPNNASAYHLTIDASGNIYTPNSGTLTISKITPDGTLTAAWATLSQMPFDIAFDASMNAFTANRSAGTVSKITASAAVTDPYALLANTANCYSIITDGDGNIYTANSGINTISKITPDGTVTQAWATLSTGSSPFRLVIDTHGNIYSTNTANSTISKITPDGTVTSAWATLAVGSNNYGITIDGENNIYTANYSKNTVSKITPEGTVTAVWAALASNAAPFSITIDKATGTLYTANLGNGTISKLTGAAALPISLANFSGSLQNGTASLQWETGVESNFNHFELQTSNNGTDYTAVATIPAKGGNSSYSYGLAQAIPTQYYRLKMVDNDKSSSFSKIVILSQNESGNSVQLFPNPAKHYINVNIPEAGILKVFTASGQLVKTQTIIAGATKINLAGLPAGVYYALVDGQKIKFIKE